MTPKGGRGCVGNGALRTVDTCKPAIYPREIVSHGTWSMDAQVNFGSMTVGVTLQLSGPPSGSITLTFSSNTPSSTSLTMHQKFSDWS